MRRPDSIILESLARLAFFFINLYAIYLMLRGHNLPGGGFIAGLVTAISFVLLSMGLGLGEIRRIMKIDPAWLGFGGLTLAALTATAPVFIGAPFFSHYMFHFHVPLLGELEAGTTLLFDLGVYLVVVGVSVKIVLMLAWSTAGHPIFEHKSEEERYASILERPIEEAATEGERKREAEYAD